MTHAVPLIELMTECHLMRTPALFVHFIPDRNEIIVYYTNAFGELRKRAAIVDITAAKTAAEIIRELMRGAEGPRGAA